MSQRSDFSFGKWILGILATVLGAILIYVLLDKDIGLLRPAPTEVPPIPHAPPLQISIPWTAYDELTMTLVLQAGEQKLQRMRDLWNAPAGSEPGCAGAIIFLSWIVRDPYPGGDDFQVLENVHVPQTENYRKVLASGSQGNLSLGYCYALTFVNNSTTTYKVEIRYASAQ
jgi:hypothetical protein